jgi:hypothetical protein
MTSKTLLSIEAVAGEASQQAVMLISTAGERRAGSETRGDKKRAETRQDKRREEQE